MLNAFVPYLVVVWIVAMVAAFPLFGRPRHAVLFIVVSGTLFLPETLLNFLKLGIFNFTKYDSICYAALLGSLFFDPGRLFALRPTVTDLAAIVWCLCPLPSVLTNEAPPDGSPLLRDALVQTFGQIVSFGIPYLMGRAYFTNRESFRDLGLAMVVGGMVYVPLCLYEIKMSPELHLKIYGYIQHDYLQTLRGGGYRPLVFMSNGLVLSIFMMSSAIFAWLMWQGREFPRPSATQIPFAQYLPFSPGVLAVTLLLVKSTGASILGIVGAIAIQISRLTKSHLPLFLLVVWPVFYVTLRVSRVWTGESLVQFVAENLGPERASSIDTRFRNENDLAIKALIRPWFGWGGWGRNRITNDAGQDICITDGFWIITLGVRGFVGLIALGGVALLPIVRYAFLFSPSKSLHYASGTAAAYALALATIDSLPNAALAFPIHIFIAGALAGLQPDPRPSPLLVGVSP